MRIALGLFVAICAVWIGSLAYSDLPRPHVLASYGTPLAGRSHSQRHNSILALERIQGAEIKPGGVFSFVRRVGTFSEDQGYRRAPVSYNGQLISDWGGGVCQTSTTLYNAALLAGMKILERHRHRFAPGYISPGRDAAVAYSNIDLRFQNPYPYPVRIEGATEGDMLVVSIVGPKTLRVHPQILSEIKYTEDFQTFRIGRPGGETHIRNTGKDGCQVAVYRVTGDLTELISNDTYPAMNRVVQYR